MEANQAQPKGKPRKNFSGLIIGILIGLFLLIVLLRCFYSVDEQHNAVVTQFGKIVKVNTAGFYVKAPWQKVKKVDMTTHGTGIGYVVSSTGQNLVDKDNGIMITSDFNLLNIGFRSDCISLQCRRSGRGAFQYRPCKHQNRGFKLYG